MKNTHEAIIDQELWDTVQRVREHKRRPPKHMDAPGLFAGLVYCADCGGYMVLCRTGENEAGTVLLPLLYLRQAG